MIFVSHLLHISGQFNTCSTLLVFQSHIQLLTLLLMFLCCLLLLCVVDVNCNIMVHSQSLSFDSNVPVNMFLFTLILGDILYMYLNIVKENEHQGIQICFTGNWICKNRRNRGCFHLYLIIYITSILQVNFLMHWFKMILG